MGRFARKFKRQNIFGKKAQRREGLKEYKRMQQEYWKGLRDGIINEKGELIQKENNDEQS